MPLFPWLCAALYACSSDLLMHLFNCTCDAKVLIYNTEILEWNESDLSGEYQIFRGLLKNYK